MPYPNWHPLYNPSEDWETRHYYGRRLPTKPSNRIDAVYDGATVKKNGTALVPKWWSPQRTQKFVDAVTNAGVFVSGVVGVASGVYPPARDIVPLANKIRKIAAGTKVVYKAIKPVHQKLYDKWGKPVKALPMPKPTPAYSDTIMFPVSKKKSKASTKRRKGYYPKIMPFWKKHKYKKRKPTTYYDFDPYI